MLSRFYKFFPVPDYLNLSTVGIDISDESIKFAELKKTKGWKVARCGTVDLPAGCIIAGKIMNREALVSALRQIQQENKIDLIHASLPEEETFVVRMKVPEVKRADLRESIELLLEEHIPLSIDQVVFDYEIYREPTPADPNFILGVFVAPIKLVEDYTGVIEESGLRLASLEIEVQSGARALIKSDDLGTYLIVDIGKTRTGFSIISNQIVLFTSSIKSIGGANMTQAIERSLNVGQPEAENLKIQKGLLNSPSNKEVFQALIPVVSAFKDEMSRHCIYWQTMAENHEVEEGIRKIIFSGGQSTLPGLTEYISANIEFPVEIGKVWNLDTTEGRLSSVDYQNSLRYVTAIGLALRGINL